MDMSLSIAAASMTDRLRLPALNMAGVSSLE
jgi:hypothetical protein